MRHFVLRSFCFGLASLALACGGAGDGDGDTDQGALERGEHAGTTRIEPGSFAMTAGRAVHALPGFGCRRYMSLDLHDDASGAKAVFEAALDSADPSDMDPDGACGGQELPRPTGHKYPLNEISKDRCGIRVLEGTVVWTDSGRVTRTLRITDSRAATCGQREARIKLEESRTLDGESHAVETYFSVDPT